MEDRFQCGVGFVLVLLIEMEGDWVRLAWTDCAWESTRCGASSSDPRLIN